MAAFSGRSLIVRVYRTPDRPWCFRLRRAAVVSPDQATRRRAARASGRATQASIAGVYLPK